MITGYYKTSGKIPKLKLYIIMPQIYKYYRRALLHQVLNHVKDT